MLTSHYIIRMKAPGSEFLSRRQYYTMLREITIGQENRNLNNMLQKVRCVCTSSQNLAMIALCKAKLLEYIELSYKL